MTRVKYPIITKIREPQEVEVGGNRFIAAETIIMDYGPEGKSIGYIRAPKPDPEAAARERENMNCFLRKYGYQLAEE